MFMANVIFYYKLHEVFINIINMINCKCLILKFIKMLMANVLFMFYARRHLSFLGLHGLAIMSSHTGHGFYVSSNMLLLRSLIPFLLYQ